jgi:glycosyltransferase involved in cell wall biosynthesis
LKRSATLRASWGADEATPVAIYVGRAAAEKNIPLALEAWEAARVQQPDLKMVVVGDGPVRRKLERQWPDVIFAGMRYDEDLAAHYASADLFIFGSESETFGNVVVEALASGLVAVTFDYAAGRQFIRHGINGFLSPLGDREAFCRLVAEVAEDASKWPALRIEARASVEKYPWSETIERFSRFLHKAGQVEQKLPRVDSSPEMTETLTYS